MRKKNSYRAGIEQRLEAARQGATQNSVPAPEPAPAPKPDPLPDFRDPAVRSELLADELRDTKAALEAERKARASAEKRAAAAETERVQAGSRTGLASLIGKRRKALWK